MEKLRPLGDRVIVKRKEQAEKTAGGIFIPATAQEKAQIAEVIEVGTGRVTDEGKVIAMTVKKGDIVGIGKFAGTEVNDGCLVVREDEILYIIGN
ncbi:MAG: co-chaperone GroES [Candidatus Babeliales bacterium]